MTDEEKRDDMENGVPGMDRADIERKLKEMEDSLGRQNKECMVDDKRPEIPPMSAQMPSSQPSPPPPPPPPRMPITPTSPYTPTPPPKRGSLKGFFIYITIIFMMLTAISVGLVLIFGEFDLHGVYPAKEQVAVIYVQGVMITGGVPDGFGFATSENICKNIRLASNDENVNAIVLRVNSPGGSPASAQEIANEIKKTEKPVVISMGDVAASAAYYISAPADWVIANPDTITGSIGVVWVFENKSGYYDEEGIEHWVAKSGEFKDMGADWRNLTDDEKGYAEEVVMDAFSRFVDEIAVGRNLTRDHVLNLSDGRVYTGTSAIDLGLVDQTGNLYDAIDVAAELGNITDEDPAITYMNKPSLSQLLFGGTEHFNHRIDFESLDSARFAQQCLCRSCILDPDAAPAGSRT